MIKDIIDAALDCKIAGVLTDEEFNAIYDATVSARERLAKEK